MANSKSYVYVTSFLLVIPILISSFKYASNQVSVMDIIPRDIYQVSMELDIPEIPDNSFIKSYIPRSDQRQKISNHTWYGDSLCMNQYVDHSGLIATWDITGKRDVLYGYSYLVESKSIKFDIPQYSPFENFIDQNENIYLQSSEHIQSDHPSLDSIAQDLKSQTVLKTLEANFDFVRSIEDSNTRVLTDALSAWRLNRASCNGKSRLFTAICRAQGLPSRVVGGTILSNVSKRTTHLWSEVFYAGKWIPFDVLNDHFASLPSNYLQLYIGDEFLFSYSDRLDFDYQFIIEKKYQSLDQAQYMGFNLWPLLNNFHLPTNLLRALLLLPLAALIIAIIRNVIGIKTFGILLPALIGLALVNIDLGIGLLGFSVVITLVALLHLVLDKWSLLHIPKIAIILTSVVLVMMLLSSLGAIVEWQAAQLVVFLPIVIVSITAERFAKVLTEESMSDAIKMLRNTFFVAMLTCLIFRSKVLLGIFLTFPEHYLSILFVLLILGKWIGMRLTEYNRFHPALD